MPEEQMTDDLKLQDIFDLDFLQKFQDNLSGAVGIAINTVDLEGKSVTRRSNFKELCMKYTRGCPKGSKRCEECGKKGGAEAARTGKPAVYECHAGLMDFAAPIMLNGKRIGAILGGQVLTGPPDVAKFRAYAQELGIDPDAYYASALKSPIVTPERLRQAAETLYLMAETLSRLGYFQHKLRVMSEKVTDTVHHVSATMQELAASSHDVDKNQRELNIGIDSVAEIAGKIDEFTELIRNIAKQTRLLGLNASIEAARAGAAGAGFGVVAEQIGKLADNSSDAVDKVQEFTGRINDSVRNTVDKGKRTLEIVDNQTKAIQASAENLEGIAETAEELNRIAHSV